MKEQGKAESYYGKLKSKARQKVTMEINERAMENERARQGRKLLWKMKEQGKAKQIWPKHYDKIQKGYPLQIISQMSLRIN